MLHVEIKVKQNLQTLKDLLNLFGHEYFPRIYSQLNPYNKDRKLVLPYLGSEDSSYSLAFKMMAMDGLERKTTTQELVRNFSRMSRRDQLFIAYNLSHELKIASLAASIAMSKQDSNAYEVGPCLGFSSLHFSHLLKEKGMNSKPIGKLTTIEHNREFLERAKEIEKMTGDYVGVIEHIHGDGIEFLRRSLKNGDIVFCSIAEPPVVSGILDLLVIKTINVVISYSEMTNKEVAKLRCKRVEDLIDPNSYEIFPFEDRDYNTHAFDENGKIGILALPIFN